MKYGSSVNWNELHERHRQTLMQAIEEEKRRQIHDSIYFPNLLEAAQQQDAINASASAGAGSAGGGNPVTEPPVIGNQGFMYVLQNNSVSPNYIYAILDSTAPSHTEFFDTGVPNSDYSEGSTWYIWGTQNSGWLLWLYTYDNAYSVLQFIAKDGNLIAEVDARSFTGTYINSYGPNLIFVNYTNGDGNIEFICFNGERISTYLTPEGCTEFHLANSTNKSSKDGTIYVKLVTSDNNYWVLLSASNDNTIPMDELSTSSLLDVVFYAYDYADFFVKVEFDNDNNVYSLLNVYDTQGNILHSFSIAPHSMTTSGVIQFYGSKQFFATFANDDQFYIAHYDGDTGIAVELDDNMLDFNEFAISSDIYFIGDSNNYPGNPNSSWADSGNYIPNSFSLAILHSTGSTGQFQFEASKIRFYNLFPGATAFKIDNLADGTQSYPFYLDTYSAKCTENSVCWPIMDPHGDFGYNGVSGTSTGVTAIYTGLTAAGSLSGSELIFSIEALGDGTYIIEGLTNNNGPAKFLNGDTFVIPGTSLGGASPDNDATIVAVVDPYLQIRVDNSNIEQAVSVPVTPIGNIYSWEICSGQNNSLQTFGDNILVTNYVTNPSDGFYLVIDGINPSRTAKLLGANYSNARLRYNTLFIRDWNNNYNYYFDSNAFEFIQLERFYSNRRNSSTYSTQGSNSTNSQSFWQKGKFKNDGSMLLFDIYNGYFQWLNGSIISDEIYLSFGDADYVVLEVNDDVVYHVNKDSRGPFPVTNSDTYSIATYDSMGNQLQYVQTDYVNYLGHVHIDERFYVALSNNEEDKVIFLVNRDSVDVAPTIDNSYNIYPNDFSYLLD